MSTTKPTDVKVTATEVLIPTFDFGVDKVTEVNSKGEVTIKLTKGSEYMSQALDPEESKRVFAEVGEYQRQMAKFSVEEGAKILKSDSKTTKVKVKTPYGTTEQRFLGVDATIVRERQLGPEQKGAYVSLATKSSEFVTKDFMKDMRDTLASKIK